MYRLTKYEYVLIETQSIKILLTATRPRHSRNTFMKLDRIVSCSTISARADILLRGLSQHLE